MYVMVTWWAQLLIAVFLLCFHQELLFDYSVRFEGSQNKSQTYEIKSQYRFKIISLSNNTEDC